MNKKIVLPLSVFLVISALIILLTVKANTISDSLSNGSAVRINEVVIDNVTGITDDDGEHSDWIELYNPNDFDINLKDYSLTDDADVQDKWLFPDVTIQAKSYLVIFASGKSKRNTSEYIHTSFRLSDDGEGLYLYDNDGTELDAINIPNDLRTNYSYGLAMNKNYKYCSFTHPTPGNANLAQTYKKYMEVKPLGKIKFSSEGGYYNDSFYLTLSSDNTDAQIVYTTDGSEPNESSKIYQGPIEISPDLNPNHNAGISTRVNIKSKPESIYLPQYKYKGVVIRARLIENNCLSDAIETQTYLIRPDFDLPVISISCNNEDLFSYEKGIYVPGLFFDVWKKYNTEVYNNYHPIANYSQEREITCALEYFDTDGVKQYQQDVGVQISGKASRNFPCKSLKITARKKYSNCTRLEFDFLQGAAFNHEHESVTSYKNIVLRNSGNDTEKTMFRDAFMQNIAIENHIDLSPQAWQPVIVLINGEYWGIHNIREAHDEYYIESHYNIDHSNVETYHYFRDIYLPDKDLSLGEYILSNDMSNSDTFDYISSIIDMDNFATYLAFEIYIANTDWPNGNILMWRATSPGNHPFEDGKIRMILYDVDFGFSDYQNNSIARLMDVSETGKNYISNMAVIEVFMKNEMFRKKLISKIDYMLNHVFIPTDICNQIDSATAKIDADIANHFERWNYSNIIHMAYLKYKGKSDPSKHDIWLEKVKELKEFAYNRPEYIKKYLLEYRSQ